jgi:hypothetical protein
MKIEAKIAAINTATQGEHMIVKEGSSYRVYVLEPAGAMTEAEVESLFAEYRAGFIDSAVDLMRNDWHTVDESMGNAVIALAKERDAILPGDPFFV